MRVHACRLSQSVASSSSVAALLPRKVSPSVFSKAYATDAAQGQAGATSGKKQLLSSCREGTPLTGLSIEKDRPDPLAKADEAYPAWLWSIVGDSDLVSGSPSSSGGAAGASTMTKGEARAAQKRSVKAARAQQRRGGVDGSADSVAAVNSAKAVGQRDAAEQRFASAEASIRAAEAAEAARAEARRSLRRANREAIKARNFVGSS